MKCPNCHAELDFEPTADTKAPICPKCLSEIPLVDSEPVRKQIEPEDSVNQSFKILHTPEEFRRFAWKRWTARTIDFLIGSYLLVAICYGLGYLSGMTGVGRDFWVWVSLPENRIIDLVITTLFAFFSDSLFYAIFKTTPGKRLCGITVCSDTGKKPTGLQYLSRDLKILSVGEGFLIPFVIFVTRLRQYERVVKGKHASYDELNPYKARYSRKMSRLEILLAILLLFASAYLKQIAERG